MAEYQPDADGRGSHLAPQVGMGHLHITDGD